MKENTVVCLDCGFKYDGEQKLCPMCGSKRRSFVNEGWEPQPERRSEKKNSKLLGRIVIVTVMILTLMGVKAMFRDVLTPVSDPAPQSNPGFSESGGSFTVGNGTEMPSVPSETSSVEVPPAKPAPQPEEFDPRELKQQCQAIVDNYSARMQAATPRLIEEFKAETEGESDGRILAHVCNKKVGKLAEMCNEGMQEIWDLLYQYEIDPSREDYDQYEDYEFRLNLVYQDEAMKISDLYSEYYILHAS